MQFKPNRPLWSTVVGSHMWGMERPDSDRDYYIAYQADSRSFLLGNTHTSGHQHKGENEEEVSFEIGHAVNMVMKGNLNHVWGVVSPIEVYTGSEHKMLKEILLANPTKNMFHSIRGLAMHNIKHFLEEKKQGVSDKQNLFLKKLRTITRSLQYGITLLETGKYVFAKVEHTSPQEAYDLLRDLEVAYSNSSLPEDPPTELYEAYLLDLRVRDL